MTARLFLSGIRAHGQHGARPGEKDERQPFVVDLDLEVDAAEDTIDATADYRLLVDAVRDLVETSSFDLIETMATRIAERLVAFDHVTKATVVVHKPNAARRLGIDGAAAAVTVEA
jgi:7,8-dihydroneopterin aldolase/epimerase/oxygenase